MNPYLYLKDGDIYVQTSIHEGYVTIGVIMIFFAAREENKYERISDRCIGSINFFCQI